MNEERRPPTPEAPGEAVEPGDAEPLVEMRAHQERETAVRDAVATVENAPTEVDAAVRVFAKLHAVPQSPDAICRALGVDLSLVEEALNRLGPLGLAAQGPSGWVRGRATLIRDVLRETPPTANAKRRAAWRARHAKRLHGGKPDHGLRGLQRAVARLGAKNTLDGRYTIARELRVWRDSLLDDIGEGDPTTAQTSIANALASTHLLLQSFDAVLLTAVSKNPQAVMHPKIAGLLDRRGRILDSYMRGLGLLGLERRAKPVMDLTTYLEAKATSDDGGNEDE